MSIVLDLKSDIYYWMYNENDFELSISFVKGLFEYLSQLANTNAVPDSNPDESWTIKALYYYDDEDWLRVFSPNILFIKEEKEV